jgi:hypothetical protein
MDLDLVCVIKDAGYSAKTLARPSVARGRRKVGEENGLACVKKIRMLQGWIAELTYSPQYAMLVGDPGCVVRSKGRVNRHRCS